MYVICYILYIMLYTQNEIMYVIYYKILTSKLHIPSMNYKHPPLYFLVPSSSHLISR